MTPFICGACSGHIQRDEVEGGLAGVGGNAKLLFKEQGVEFQFCKMKSPGDLLCNNASVVNTAELC